MKKILSIVFCAAAVSVFGDTETQLGGEIGVAEVTSSDKNTIVAVSYEDLDPSIKSGIAVSNLVKTTNLTVGDQLVIYVDGEYSSWILAQEGDGKPKYWAKNEVTFMIKADGSSTEGTGLEASESIRTVGTGIWLVRNADYKPGTEFKFYLYGKPVSAPQTTIAGGAVNLVGNPTPNPVTLTEGLEGMLKGATKGDRIEVPGGTGILGRLVYTYDGTQWQTFGSDHKLTPGLPTIPANQGFWYVSKGGSFTMSWPTAN